MGERWRSHPSLHIYRPIDPSRPQDIKPLPYYAQMAKACGREEAARKPYFEKVWAYLECEQRK